MHWPHFRLDQSFILQDKFWLLRKVASLLKYLAWFILGAGMLLVIVGTFHAVTAGDLSSDLKLLVGVIVSVTVGFVYFLSLGESIQVMLDMEENTRRTAIILTELHNRMYPPAPPAMPAGPPQSQPFMNPAAHSPSHIQPGGTASSE